MVQHLLRAGPSQLTIFRMARLTEQFPAPPELHGPNRLTMQSGPVELHGGGRVECATEFRHRVLVALNTEFDLMFDCGAQNGGRVRWAGGRVGGRPG